MKSIGFSGGLYRPLSEEQARMIHESSLLILERTGFTYEKGFDSTLEMLKKAGATVYRDRSRITFPRDLIMEQVDRAPEQVILYSRDGKNDLDLSKDRVYMGTGGAAIKILDLETGQARATILWDLYLLGRLVDQLDNINFFLRPCIPQDIPHAAYDVNIFYTCFKATSKHIMGGVNDEEGFHKVLDLSSMAAGDVDKLRGKSCNLRQPASH